MPVKGGTVAGQAYRDQKIRTISSNEAKQHWGAMMKAASSGEAVIVESHGKPRAVVISPEAFEELRQARERQRREEAMRLLREIEASYDGRNDDLTAEQVEELAVREGREINRALAKRLREQPRRTR
jgi:prevent-host-death family protein